MQELKGRARGDTIIIVSKQQNTGQGTGRQGQGAGLQKIKFLSLAGWGAKDWHFAGRNPTSISKQS